MSALCKGQQESSQQRTMCNIFCFKLKRERIESLVREQLFIAGITFF